MAISVFDLFKIGIGPSSSHTVGPMKAAAQFVERLREAGTFDRVARVRVELYGSLGATGRGHGSDKAVILGLEGERPEDVDVESISGRVEAVRERERLRLGGERDIAFEEYLVDASLRVHNAPRSNGGENIRLVEIRKTRGQGHTSGRHPFLLSDEGLQVFPRLRPQDVRFGLADLHHPERTRVSTGVAGLDEMLGGGIWENSVNAVSGYQGTGKSVLAYHFLDRQLAAGGKALYVSFYRSPGQIIADVGSLHMDWVPAHEEGRLHLMRADWVGVTPEVFLNRLFRKVAELGPDAVVIDSLNDFIGLCDDGRRVRDDILVLAEMLRSVGATAMLLQRLTVMRGDSANADESYGELMDAHLQLTMAESDGQLQRFVSIRKHSGSSHVSELREVEIDSAGMHVGEDLAQRGLVVGDAPEMGDAVDEDAPHSHLLDQRVDEVVAAAEGVEDALRRSPDDAELAGGLQRFEVDAVGLRLFVDLAGELLEGDDEPRLAVLAHALGDHAHAEGGLARARRAFDQQAVPAHDPALEELVETGDSGGHASDQVVHAGSSVWQ